MKQWNDNRTVLVLRS